MLIKKSITFGVFLLFNTIYLDIFSSYEVVKEDIMRLAVFEKFRQNPAIRRELLATGHATLIEHTKNDNYWADNGDGTGKNMLGIILMETRKRLKAE